MLMPGPVLGCRLALILALDVSSSVDPAEYDLQRTGLATAMVAPEVEAAFLASPAPVALAVFEWSGRFNQEIVLPWTIIGSATELRAASSVVATRKRSTTGYQTALGHALGYASRYFDEGPECSARTIDISGDGESNHGYPPAQAYDIFPLEGVTVNALAIGRSVGTDNLEVYYRRQVIRGPGAFVEEATDYLDFERAMRQKLRREVLSFAIGAR